LDLEFAILSFRSLTADAPACPPRRCTRDRHNILEFVTRDVAERPRKRSRDARRKSPLLPLAIENRDGDVKASLKRLGLTYPVYNCLCWRTSGIIDALPYLSSLLSVHGGRLLKEKAKSTTTTTTSTTATAMRLVPLIFCTLLRTAAIVHGDVRLDGRRGPQQDTLSVGSAQLPAGMPSRSPKEVSTQGAKERNLSPASGLHWSIIAVYDSSPGETSWAIQDTAMGTEVYTIEQSTASAFPPNHQLEIEDVSFEQTQKYTITMTDSAGDGFCCSNGFGYITIRMWCNGEVIWQLFTKGDFTSEKIRTFRMPVKECIPLALPTAAPATSPSSGPAKVPTGGPTKSPSVGPTPSPISPSASPEKNPTGAPIRSSTSSPSAGPMLSPSGSPTESPRADPMLAPTGSPSDSPDKDPTGTPVSSPTLPPSAGPTPSPSSSPTKLPSAGPTHLPTKSPALNPPSNNGLHWSIVAIYDANPGETSWVVEDTATGREVYAIDKNSASSFPPNHGLEVKDVYFEQTEQYRLTMTDSVGNGFCCGNGFGYVTIRMWCNDDVIWQLYTNGDFSSERIRTFRIPLKACTPLEFPTSAPASLSQSPTKLPTSAAPSKAPTGSPVISSVSFTKYLKDTFM